MIRIAINGFGRIGRSALKIAFERRDLEIVAINDLAPTATLAHLLKYDSTYGVYQYQVSSESQFLVVAGRKIPTYAIANPAELPWKELNVDLVIEATGLFTDPKVAKAHLQAGAKKVVISAPAKGEGAKTIVLGVNEEILAPNDKIISNASCTTNAIAPVMRILSEKLGIEKAMMTTIHSYTASQTVLDAPKKDLRLSRSAAENIIPASTGASQAAALTIPALKDRFNGFSVRVPTPTVSLADITAVTTKSTTKDKINQLFIAASSEAYFQGILTTTDQPLVSSDLKGNSHSAVVDLSLTDVVGGNLIKVVVWYDNEWGYANRLVELAADFGKAN